MVVNFRICRISRGTYKLTRTSILIKKEMDEIERENHARIYLKIIKILSFIKKIFFNSLLHLSLSLSFFFFVSISISIIL